MSPFVLLLLLLESLLHLLTHWPSVFCHAGSLSRIVKGLLASQLGPHCEVPAPTHCDAKEVMSVVFVSCSAVHYSGGGQYRQREAGHL